MSEVKTVAKKRNLTFSFMYFLGILMVIDVHTGNSINILNSIFPYESFFMPMFFFASGYFFKHRPLKQAIVHKTKNLYLRYLIWNVVIFIVALIIDAFCGTHWSSGEAKRTFIESLYFGPLVNLNEASWFVVTLFAIELIYILFDHFAKNRTKAFDLFSTIIITWISLVACMMAFYHAGYEHGELPIWINRVLFYLCFYNFGYIFHKYLEKPLNSIKHAKFIVTALCTFINLVLISIFGYEKLGFPITLYMGHFNSFILPFITSVTGILFYYFVSQTLAKWIGENRFVELVSRNTFIILETHMIGAHLPDIIRLAIHRFSPSHFTEISSSRTMLSPWNGMHLDCQPIAFFLGLFFSLFVVWALKKLKPKFSSFCSKLISKLHSQHSLA